MRFDLFYVHFLKALSTNCDSHILKILKFKNNKILNKCRMVECVLSIIYTFVSASHKLYNYVKT